MRVASAMSFIGREALRIVLPSWCVACRRHLPWRDRVASCCGSCWRALPRMTVAKCATCALPWRAWSVAEWSVAEWSAADPAAPPPTNAAESAALHVGHQCIPCSTEPQPLEWCESWGEYRDGLERVLHAFKFERHDFLDRPLAGLMHETLLARGDDDFDAVVPVPMHRKKQRKRGYNQAHLLAEALGEAMRIRAERNLLLKSVEKKTQSTLARHERASNVRGTFAVKGDARDQSLLLVDDICTTGETLRACARELLGAGAARVCAVTVAKAV
ncbi:MAG TPA: ComF family protein [Thermoanaerobaculia bacterium]|nr:ComF family protein [Thermoanaerobaculia bacterium]